MREQRRRIHDDGWRLMVVLDACRYDAFDRIHPDHLSGRLSAVRSAVDPGTSIATASWCRRTFDRAMDDVVYVSATPAVNSRRAVGGFDAADRFAAVVDVWDDGWDDEVDTVPPERVTREARRVLVENPDRRVIAHYLQPHAPYLAAGGAENPPPRSPEGIDVPRRVLKRVVGGRLRRLVGGPATRRMLRSVGAPAPSRIHEALRRLGPDGLVRAYESDLARALESVAGLADDCDGAVVVTADHGEALGDDGFYGHSYLPRLPVLTRVPWFVADGRTAPT